MAQGPSDTILVAIWITLRIRESKVRNPDPPDWRRFVLCECILVILCFTGHCFLNSFYIHWLNRCSSIRVCDSNSIDITLECLFSVCSWYLLCHVNSEQL